MKDDALAPIRSTYDKVARAYADALSDELADKPIERALLDAFAEICKERPGRVADMGCGPGHVTRYLADLGVDAVGIDLSSAMVTEARERFPGLPFEVGSMTALEAPDASFAGIVALYSIIHLGSDDRARAFREMLRVLHPGAHLLVSFHVCSADHPAGTSIHLEQWFEQEVDLSAHLLEPPTIEAELRSAGFEIRAKLEREPWTPKEFPSRRCYFIARRSERA